MQLTMKPTSFQGGKKFQGMKTILLTVLLACGAFAASAQKLTGPPPPTILRAYNVMTGKTNTGFACYYSHSKDAKEPVTYYYGNTSASWSFAGYGSNEGAALKKQDLDNMEHLFEKNHLPGVKDIRLVPISMNEVNKLMDALASRTIK